MELKDVKELIAFDKETVKSVENIYEKKATVLKEIALEKEEIARSSWAEVEKKVNERKNELDKKIAQDKEVNEAHYKKIANDLETKFNNNKQEWEKDLFERCIK